MNGILTGKMLEFRTKRRTAKCVLGEVIAEGKDTIVYGAHTEEYGPLAVQTYMRHVTGTNAAISRA